MRRFTWLKNLARLVKSDQRGLTLIEVVISVALMGLLGAALLQGLSGVARGQGKGDERVGAVVAGRAQLESVKQSPYDATVTTTPGPAYLALPTQATVGGVLFDMETIGQQVDTGVQLVTVMVSNGGQEITRLQAYKVNR
ncbi:MAG: prepilin-type N-terminal cleavage/methylation domain-containing protein [Chloroflexi bacterium]|nr:prepilin-type N-terminal cleavage/methylation domain-containing protein [Chloroflexota bacterium]